MKSLLALIPLALVATVAAAAVAKEPDVYSLSALNGSGEYGPVTLIAIGPRQTRVAIRLVGEPAGVAQPAHIHRGPCSRLDPRPVYGLAPVVNGRSDTIVPANITTLLDGGYSVNVHRSAAQLGVYVACGDLHPRAESTPNAFDTKN